MANVVNALIVLILIVVAFMYGKKISDDYNNRIISELQYQLRIYSAERYNGYVAPPVQENPIGQPFMDRLRRTGRATQAIRTSPN